MVRKGGPKIPAGMYTRNAAATSLGVSPDTIREWKRKGYFKPAGQTRAGELTIPLYTQDQLGQMKHYMTTGELPAETEGK